MPSAEISAYQAGRIMGQLVFFLLLAAGLLKCISIARRPTTNAKCVWSLAFFLMTWGVASVYGLVLRGQPDLRILAPLAGILFLGLVVTSVTLAIMGLIEYARKREQFNQGRAQAIWALILSGGFILLMAVGAVSTAFKTSRLKNQPVSGQQIRFEESNFRFTVPGRPWVQADAAKISREAKLVFIRNAPELYLMISADPIGLDLGTDGMAESARVRMESSSRDVKIVSRKPVRVGALQGLEVQSEARLGSIPIYFVQWFCSTNGWGYQVAAWGALKHKQEVIAESRRLFPRLEPIDLQRFPAFLTGEMLEDVVCEPFGYNVSYRNSSWVRWAQMDEDCPYASEGAMHREDAAMAVTAVALGDLSADTDTLCRGLCSLFTTQDPMKNARRIREGPLEGIETTLTQVLTGTEYRYNVKVLCGNGFAWLVVAWVDNRHPRRDEILADAHSRVELYEPPASTSGRDALSDRQKRAQQKAINGIGLALFGQQRYEQSSFFFKKAMDLDESRTPLYLGNYSEACLQSGDFRSGLNALEEHSVLAESELSLAAKRAFFLSRLGRADDAVAAYAKIFESGYVAEAHFKEYMGLLAQSEPERALSEMELYLRREQSTDLRLAQAGLLKILKRYDDAIAVLQKERTGNPFHAGVVYSLGDALIQAGKPNEALSLGEQLVKSAGPSATAWLLKGKAQFALKWYRESKISFENAIRQSPNDTESRQFLQVLSGLLGEGSNEVIQDRIDPVSLPGELAELPAETDKTFGKEAGAYYIRSLCAISYEKGKELKQTDYLNVRLLSSAGVSTFSTFQFSFNPLSEELFVNEVRVEDARGSLVSTGRLGDFYILDDRSSAMASSRKILNIPVAGLEPGHQLSIILTRREFGTPKEVAFFRSVLSETVPALDKSVLFLGDTNQILFTSAPLVTPKPVKGGLLWRQIKPQPFHWEPSLPSIADYLPSLWLSDRALSWKEATTNYLDSIADRLAMPDVQKAVVKDLVATATNLPQKVTAIALHVQTNYTYKAIEFGRRARVPQAITDIVRNRYGDCKDHAVLAKAMLEAAGVEAHLALVNLNSPIRQDMPSLDQFNHMVVFVPDEGRGMFLDCTSKSFDLSAPWAFGIAGREALVLDSRAPRFIKVPSYPEDASRLRLIRTVEITNTSDAVVREVIEFRGVHAGMYREYFQNVPAANRRDYAASVLLNPSAELLNLRIEGLENPRAALSFELSYILRGQFHALGRELSGNMPVIIERSLLNARSSEKRVSPFEIPVPLTMEGLITVKPPENFKPAAASNPPVLDNPFLRLNVSCNATSLFWRMNYQMVQKAGRFPAAEYESHCHAMQEALQTIGSRLICAQSVD